MSEARHRSWPERSSTTFMDCPFAECRVSPFAYNTRKKRYVIDARGWRWSTRSIPFGPEGKLELGDGGRISYFPKYFSNSEEMFHALKAEVPWEEKKIHLFGKEIMQPRQICFMAADPSLTYTYSKLTLQPLPFSPTVSRIQSVLEELLKTTFNCALLNYYRNGKDHMSWHADQERFFGPDPIIASVSFGQQRSFDLRSNAQTNMRWRYWLGGGDVLIMEGGAVQQNWKHALIQNKNIKGGRINITFRLITDPEPHDDNTKQK